MRVRIVVRNQHDLEQVLLAEASGDTMAEAMLKCALKMHYTDSTFGFAPEYTIAVQSDDHDHGEWEDEFTAPPELVGGRDVHEVRALKRSTWWRGGI